MRIFHLADLHIGKKLNNVSMLSEQRAVLEQVLTAISEQRPDVLILAGDIYDRRNPSVEAVNLLDEFLSEVVLVEKVPVLAIGGNHDSGERLGFANGILAKAGLYVAGRLSLPVPEVVLTDQWGEVHFHLLPYADLLTIGHELGQEGLGDYQEAMVQVLESMEHDWAYGERHVLVAHGVVTGDEPLERSESERELTIGGTESWSSALLSRYAYVALGHLHNSQRAGAEHIRYAGSLLKYSFSEEHQQKSLTIVELDGEGTCQLSFMPLRAPRDLRTITGALAELVDAGKLDERREDYIRAELTDRGELMEPMAALRAVYPNILELRRVGEQISRPEQEIIGAEDPADIGPEALFAQFYQQMIGEEWQAKEQQVVQEMVRRVWKERE